MKKHSLVILIAGIIITLTVAWAGYASIAVQQPQKLEMLSRVGGVENQSLATVTDVFVVDSLLYVLDTSGLVILDVSAPRSPQILSQLPLPGQGMNLFVRQHRAYLSLASTNDLYIIDVARPEAPIQSKVIHLRGSNDAAIRDIFAVDDRLYALTDEYLFGLDMDGNADPAIIYNRGGIHFSVWDIGARGRYALLSYREDDQSSADEESHLILDISDESQPQPMSEFSTDRSGGKIIVQGETAYLAGGYVYDLSDLSHPTKKAIFDSEGGNGLGGLAVEGVHLLTASSTTLDVSDLPSIPIIALPPEDVVAQAIAVGNNISYVAGGRDGLLIYRFLPLTVFAKRWEAEDGAITPPMVIEQRANACGGRYVVSEESWSDGAVEFQFDAPETDNYFIWARVSGITWHHNSFRVSIDGQDPFQYEIRPPDGAWHWNQVYPEHQPVQPLGLKAGSHTIRFIAREASSDLDVLYITNHPDLRPGEANPCTAPATPTPTPSPTATPTLSAPTPTPPPIPSDFGLRLEGWLGGDSLMRIQPPITALGDVLFATEGDRMIVIDTSDPNRFEIIAKTAPLSGPITSMVVQGDYIFAQANGLSVIDVLDVRNPRVISHLSGPAGDVQVAGERAYFADENVWTIIDITQPASPKIIGRINSIAEKPLFDRQRVYVIDWDIVKMYDLTDPNELVWIGSYRPAPSYAAYSSIDDIKAQGDFLYLTNFYQGDPLSYASVLAVDVSDAANPVLMASYTLDGWEKDDLYHFRSLIINGDALVVLKATDNSRNWTTSYDLLKFDIRAPDQLPLIQERRMSYYSLPLAATETRLYISVQPRRPDLAEAYLGAVQFDTLNPLPGAKMIVGKEIGGSGDDVFLWGVESIQMIDNSAPSSPQETGHYVKASSYIRIEGNHAYIGSHCGNPAEDYLNQTCIVDLSLGMDAPCTVMPIKSEMDVSLISESGGLAFMQTQHFPDVWRIHVIDINDLENMSEVAVVDFVADDAAVLGYNQGILYVAWVKNPDPDTHYVVIAPLHRPDEPIWRMESDAPIRKVGFDRGILTILTDKELRLIDVWDLENPYEAGRYAFVGAQGEAHVLKVVNGRAYAGIGRQLRVVDVLNPATPQERGVYNAPDDVFDIHVGSSIISLAVDEAGMMNLFMPDSIYLPQMLY